MASTKQLILHVYYHIFDICLITDEAQSWSIERKWFEPAANDSEVSAISTNNTTNDFTPD